MKKKKVYRGVRFGAEVLQEAGLLLQKRLEERELSIRESIQIFTVVTGDTTWTYDTKEEFYSAYKNSSGGAIFRYGASEIEIFLICNDGYTEISIESSERALIEELSHIFDINKEKYYKEDYAALNPLTVFIGHGRSPHWRDLKDHLQDKHNIKVEAFETGARAGHTIRDILEEMAQKSTFALLVLTAEDTTQEGLSRARQNVIHEVGLFQGKLGFNRAIVLLENEVEMFSNMAGVQQIRYHNINETFGEVVATIKREFN